MTPTRSEFDSMRGHAVEQKFHPTQKNTYSAAYSAMTEPARELDLASDVQ
jgi:hypothetical protein